MSWGLSIKYIDWTLESNSIAGTQLQGASMWAPLAGRRRGAKHLLDLRSAWGNTAPLWRCSHNWGQLANWLRWLRASRREHATNDNALPATGGNWNGSNGNGNGNFCNCNNNLAAYLSIFMCACTPWGMQCSWGSSSQGMQQQALRSRASDRGGVRRAVWWGML